MRPCDPGLLHRFAAALIGGVIAALVAAPPSTAAQSAPALEVASPAEGATLHSLDLTVSGTVSGISQPGFRVLVCVASLGETFWIDDADVDATTGAFRLSVQVPPAAGPYRLTIEALRPPLPDQCVEDGFSNPLIVRRTVTVASDAVLRVEAPAEGAVLKSPEFTTSGTALRGSGPLAPRQMGVVLCMVDPIGRSTYLDGATADPTTGAFSFSASLDGGSSLAVAGEYTLIWQALAPPLPDRCDPDNPGTPTVLRTVRYTPRDTTPPRDTTAPRTTAALSGPRRAGGWYTGQVRITLRATDGAGAGVGAIYYALDAAACAPPASPSAPIPTACSVYTPGTPITLTADGTHTLYFFSVDKAGNREARKQQAVKIDATPPSCAVSTNPSRLWPPNGQLVTVTARVSVADATSGPNGFTLQSVTANEGNVAADRVGWSAGTADVQGRLRAARRGGGDGRVYSLKYRAADKAGNTATCTATVTVPHDQRG